MKNTANQNNGKNQKNIHTYGWPWETGRDLSAGVLTGEQDVSGLLSQTIQP